MAKDGLLKLNAQRLEILPEGRLLAQSICQLFDRYSPLCKTTIDAPGALIT
jgi:coproporphyrinogen III oxidase-like Fe-S oxidoreductase